MKRILVVTLSSLLLGAAPAAAQAPVGNAYGGAGALSSEVAGSSATGSPTSGGSPPSADSAVPNSGEAGPSARPAAAKRSKTATPAGTTAVAGSAQSLRGDSLPFTGIDVILMITGAGVLLVAGMAMRRLSRCLV